jgi:phosphate transport system substrate-binding protein
MYPLFNEWVSNFTHFYPNVEINTENTGSGVGEAFVTKQQVVQIGGSTAYLTDIQEGQYPNILNIPLAVSAAIINYNLPGFPQNIHLNFSARVLVEIYNGTITSWDDPALKAINPGAASLLPSHEIFPMHRSDGSGDTYMFTNYLSYNDPWWQANVGAGLQVPWPNFLSAQSAIGNPGIVIQCGNFQYSISYVALEALDLSVQKKLGFGFVQNRDGNFLNVTSINVKAALDALAPNTPADERMSIIDAPGKNAYPIVTYTYALVSNSQSNPNVAAVVRAFLTFCILKEYGNSPYFLENPDHNYHFLPLPDQVTQLSLRQVAQIGP